MKILRIAVCSAAVVFLFLLSAAQAQGQTKRSGTVVDASGPLPGAVVRVSGTDTATTAGINGEFSIDAPTGAVLEITMLGYKDAVYNVGKASSGIVITLYDDATELEESVAIGYGTVKKVNLTGAVSSVSGNTLQDRTSPTLTHMLQGSVPGLYVTTYSGNPDSEAAINIRGYTSINGGGPLVLIDGIEGNLSQLNPQDVESISVIKDASSSAIYGARAAFGVLLVTTRSGSSRGGRPVVRYNGNIGFSRPTTRTDYESRGYDSVYINDLFYRETTGSNYTFYTESDYEELYKRRNDKVENPDRPWVFTEFREGKERWIYYCNTDWYHSLFVDFNPFNRHNVSVSGSSEFVDYYFSVGYDHREGTYKVRPEQYNKYNIRSKFDFKVNKYITISDNLGFYATDYDWPGNWIPDYAFTYSCCHALASFPLKNPDGTNCYKTDFNRWGLMNGVHMELWDDTKRNYIKRYNFSNTLGFSIRPFSGFEIKGDYTWTFNEKKQMARWTNTSYSQYPGEILYDTVGRFQNKLEEWNVLDMYRAANLYASYSKTVKEAHSFKILAGINYESAYGKDNYAYGDNLTSDYINDFNVLPSILIQDNKIVDGNRNVSGGQREYAIAGAFGRFNYDYKGKYLFEVSGRFDGTSRFTRNSRWGFFPSASAGWRISEEPFYSALKGIWPSNKMRFSFGALGNQQVGYYDFVRNVTSNEEYTYLFNSTKQRFAYISSPNAGDMTWETTYHYNLGFDWGFFGGRLNTITELYIRDTKGMLSGAEEIPDVYGTTAPRANSADVRTKGYEISVSWKDTFLLSGKPFTYGISATLNDYTAKITKYKGNESHLYSMYYEGKTMGEIWGYKTDGLFASDEEAAAYTDYKNGGINQSKVDGNLTGGWRGGDVKFLDLDGDGVISNGMLTVEESGDVRVIGNSLPRWQYGLNFSASWAGFDISVFFQGIGKINRFFTNENIILWGPYCRAYITYLPKDYLDMCWSEDNQNAWYPRPRHGMNLGGSTYTNVPNDKFLLNLAYCRLKNMTISYTIPDRLVSRIGLGQAKVYVSAENLACFSPIKKINDYLDPEMLLANGPAGGFQYPWQKSFTLGIDLSF